MASLSTPTQFTVTSKRSSASEATRTRFTWTRPKFLELPRYPSKSIYLSRRVCFSDGRAGIRRNPHGVGERDGVIIVDHGSRRKESNLMLNEFVAMFREKTGYPIVEPAHMDIPSLTSEAAKEHPSVSYIITAPLGLHDLLVDVVNDRIEHCLSHVAGDAEECAVCAGTSKCRLY
ncbi:sirohydrochlorin ferrochelatase, chloroplastic isoform X2 [Corylus avellana]|uniref:sirohydrochlorin ferrochelatase, chloroplastic isoform X2 n=1 Tax=Corylus avellana TaxID=13451 RepID=UPI002869F9FB|nr:sirohydrochlorin ferrochelatase, chloroplastic isoform X2 [Corylus avellana]